MAEGPRKDDERASDAMRLKELDSRLSKRVTPEKAPSEAKSFDQAHIAWRMVTELVAGIALGVGIGFGLDELLGTKPFLLIVFVLLGLAAGIRTMLRTAAELNKEPQPKGGHDDTPDKAPDGKERD